MIAVSTAEYTSHRDGAAPVWVAHDSCSCLVCLYNRLTGSSSETSTTHTPTRYELRLGC